jgi:hypothetical protein
MKARLGGERIPVTHTPKNPRAGWADAFRVMARRGDDALLDGDVLLPTKWDNEEWVWEPSRDEE